MRRACVTSPLSGSATSAANIADNLRSTRTGRSCNLAFFGAHCCRLQSPLPPGAKPLGLRDKSPSAIPADVHRLGRAIVGLASAGIFLAHTIDAYHA